MRVQSLSLLLVVALLAPFRPASAQAPASNSVRPTAGQLAATARLSAPTVPVAERAGPVAAAVAVARQDGSRRQGVAFMIVGAAGILTGLLIDEPVISILSAGLGGVGLYLYVR